MASVCSFLFILTSLLTVCYASNKNIIVNSPFGKIKGEFKPGVNGDQGLVVFRNIPYAKPPVGELRFAKPQPRTALDGVFDATEGRPVQCIHPDLMLFDSDQGSEDCLILNIFTRSIGSERPLKKVMVFIHGGGFMIGTSAIFNMSSFVIAHDVIGVTINYRLGVLGFLSTGNEASPGNYGLWDQATALKWVKDNIEAFGGDPNDITISGESAGGSSVGYQSMSPMTKGLFSKGCPQSGTASTIFVKAHDAQKNALLVAKHSKCWEGEVTDKLDLKQSQTLIECLRKADVSSLSSFYPNGGQFGPTADGEFVPRNPILLLQDESYLESVGFYDRAYLVSIVNNEFAIIKSFMDMGAAMIRGNNATTDEEKEATLTKLEDSVRSNQINARLEFDDNMDSPIVRKIIDFYARRKVGIDATIDLVSDLSFLIPTYDFLSAASKQKKCKSWMLHFDHFPAFMKGKFKGTVHGADLLYWFDLPVDIIGKTMNAGVDGDMDDGDLQLKSLYSSLIADFMKNGVPGVSLKEHLPSGWPVYDVTNSNYLNFNLQPTVRSHLEREKRDLWLKTIPKLMEKTHQHTEL